MVVVLIITSIVVGLAFSVLNLVQKHMLVIKDNFHRKSELNTLEQVLHIDFNTYSHIEFNPIEDRLIFKTPVDSSTYFFKDTYIIRDTDTFNIHLEKKLLFFNGNRTETGTIDALKLITSKENQNKTVFVFKTNDATHFVNNGI